MQRLICCVVVTAVLAGCGPAMQRGAAPDQMVIPGVPGFQEQTRGDDCGGVALASLLAHVGITVSPVDVDAAVYDRHLGGALLPDLEKFAAEAGASPRSGRGDVDALRRLLRSGRPVLLPIDLGWSLWRRPHYVVLYGVGADRFQLHLRHGESITMPAAEFDRRWSMMGRLYLYLEP